MDPRPPHEAKAADAATSPEPGWRQAPLPDGRVLTVRRLGPDDLEGLNRLYEQLNIEDRHRRFFSAYQPSQRFLKRMTGVADHGAFGVAAVVETPEGDREVVGEATCTPLPNGDGELAMTIAEPWRGWLGAYLLDALVEAAAARGIPNLEADVLVTNGSMLALLRARGQATMEHTDWTVVRVVIGTSGPMPTWPGAHDRPRVLVEVPGGRWHAERHTEEAGVQLLTCPGPLTRRQNCPALKGERCPLAEGADVIVIAGPPGEEPWTTLRDTHARVHAGVPVCVEHWAGGAHELEDAEPASGPDGDEAVRRVHQLLRHHDEEDLGP